MTEMEVVAPALEIALLDAVVTGATGPGGSSLGGGGAATSHCAGGSGGSSVGFALGPLGPFGVKLGLFVEAFP